jgi:hypothetical protein
LLEHIWGEREKNTHKVLERTCYEYFPSNAEIHMLRLVGTTN